MLYVFNLSKSHVSGNVFVGGSQHRNQVGPWTGMELNINGKQSDVNAILFTSGSRTFVT